MGPNCADSNLKLRVVVSGNKPANPRSPASSPLSRIQHNPRRQRDIAKHSITSEKTCSVGATKLRLALESLAAVDDAAKDTTTGGGHYAIFNILQSLVVRMLNPHSTIWSASQRPPTSETTYPITLTAIPHVDDSVFEDYLNEIESLVDAFQWSRLESPNGTTLLSRNAPFATDEHTIPCETRKTIVLKNRQRKPALLSTIPSVYFEEEFRLENPRTFDAVSENAKISWQSRNTTGHAGKGSNSTAVDSDPQVMMKVLSNNAMLLEKLSWYVDTVEINLISSILQNSDSFFAVLGSFRKLQTEATYCISKVQKLRADLAHLDNEMAVSGLKIISMRRRCDNVKKLSEAIRQLQHVLEGVNHCEELLDSGQFETAVQRISYVEQLAHGKLDLKLDSSLHWLLPSPLTVLIDLRQLNVLGELWEGIDQIYQRIGKGYELRLLDVLLRDLRQHVSSVPSRDTLARWNDSARRLRSRTEASSPTPAYMIATEKLREELIPVLQGLTQSQHMAAASATFREAVIQEMKHLIRQHLPSSSEDDSESIAPISTQAGDRQPTRLEKSTILSRNLRALSPENAETLFINTYCGIGEALRRLSIQVKVLLDITSSMDKITNEALTPVRSPGRIRTPTAHLSSHSAGLNSMEMINEVVDLSSLLGQAVDKAQSDTMKVLRARTEPTVHLGLTDFLRYFALNRLFVGECETVSGKSRAAFRSVVNHHVEDFLPLLHEVEKQGLAQQMEIEKWERINFEPEDTVILTRILQSATDDPAAWLDYMNIGHANLEADELNSRVDDSSAEPTNPTEQTKPGSALGIIGEEKFVLIDSAVSALRGAEKYTILLVSVPSMANDISAILLDYLKLYNSRVQQLILGGGAKLTAGLPSINTKHLALASQSLSFFVALIPSIRESVRRRSSVTDFVLAEYDQIGRLFKDHQGAIHDKFIDIMSSRAAVCVRAMEKIEWDDVNEVQRNVSPHMETLTNETLVLHRVLCKYLPALSVKSIVGRVLITCKERLGKAFELASVRTKAGQARLLRDAELLEAKLSKIDDKADLGMYMIDVVREKQVAAVSTISAPSDDAPA